MTTGSVILGVWTLILSLVIMVPLIGYISDTDIQGLDVILHNQKTMEKVLEDSLKMHSWTEGAVSEIMEQVRSWFPTLVLVCTCYAGVTAFFSLLLVVGVCCEVSETFLSQISINNRLSNANMVHLNMQEQNRLPYISTIEHCYFNTTINKMVFSYLLE